MSNDVQSSLKDLKALSRIINESINVIERIAIDQNLKFPSIDTPYSEESEQIRKDLAIVEATFNIVSAASRLVAIARPAPQSILLNCSLNAIPSALLAAVETNVAEVLRDAGPQGLHVEQIALQSNTDSNKLARILRLLATESVFREVSPDVFANNRLSSLLDTGKSLDELTDDPASKHSGTTGIPACVVSCVRHAGKAMPCISDTLLDTSSSKSYGPEKAAFVKAFKSDKTFFAWLDLEGNEKERMIFGYAMNGYANTIDMTGQKGHGLDAFPWGELPSESVVVDVGGGIGSQTMPIVRAYPELRLVVQDMEQVIRDAQGFWENKFPEALTSERVKLQATDFFTGQLIKNASMYLLKQVLHDWPDDLCVTILKHIRDAAGPDTQLLISERVILYACDESDIQQEILRSDTVAEAKTEMPPKPLLPNGGHAMSIAYIADLQMMGLLNGQERTLIHYVALLRRSGWRLEKVFKNSYFMFPELQIIAIPT